ncbi:MAG: Clp protease ClpP [Lachnospiraceae bacterium]|jgi:Protease subunit of ATP-dependent Clp proteases
MVKINVKGPVISNDYAWLYKWLEMDCCCPKDIETALEEAAGDDVCIEINSPGGLCASAFEIYTALKQYQGKVTANVIVACSAATVIACGADETYASGASIFMIHNSQSQAAGDYRDLQMGADALKEINESLINVYEKKTGLSREEIQDLMDNDTYMSPAKAIEKGFINGLMPGMDTKDGKEGTAINAVASVVAGMFNSFAYAVPEDKAALLKRVIMDGMGQQDTGNNAAGAGQVPAAVENKEGENKMTLEEAIAKNPELKEELGSLLKEAEAKGVTGERNRLKELDAISASVAQEALNNAKYGEKPLDAKEFAYQAMLDDKIKMSAYMPDAVSDAEEAGVNNVGILPEGGEVSNEADELAAYANKRKEV